VQRGLGEDDERFHRRDGILVLGFDRFACAKGQQT
jgi:hypothetical protein